MMTKITENPTLRIVGIVVVAALLITVAAYFFWPGL